MTDTVGGGGVPVRVDASPRAVAVVRLTALGDVVLTTPAVSALKAAWPGTRTIFVTRGPFVPLVAHHPDVEQVVAWDAGTGAREMATRLRALGVDALLDLHGKPRVRLLAWMLGARRFQRWTKRPWQDELPVRLRLRPYRARTHIAARYHAAVEALVGRTLERRQMRIHVAEEDSTRGVGLLRAAGVGPGERTVLMSPGANWETKRWPVERWTELGRLAAGRGMRVVLSGTAAEGGLTGSVAAAVPGAVDLAGKLDLGALMGVMQCATAVVANDSGPMHMARALGVPTLAFFGSTDPAQFDWTGHERLFAGLPCSPCSFYGLHRCPEGHFGCMTGLSVAEAGAALERLAQRSPRLWVVG